MTDFEKLYQVSLTARVKHEERKAKAEADAAELRLETERLILLDAQRRYKQLNDFPGVS